MMLHMAVTLRMDAAGIRRAVAARLAQGLPVVAAQVLADCNRYARDDTGRLIRSSYAASDLAAGRLVWRTPYARRVYYAGTPSLRVNGAASLRWCEKAKAAHAMQWESLAQKTIGGGQG
ncbi:MAG: minor capsid protein [Candidatus Limiplasma sp.]|nr:minor capsid protein [Candidatus Limiplasma sp.]MEA5145752.1 minor capsid protein [Candidatus Limiplasma sp.]